MLVPGGPITALAEEFRLVKRQLLLTARAVAAKDGARAADRARMILVCSAQPDEGKTFCAINLALSMAAEKDMEILLVDADFAKPDVLGRLGLPEGPGLLDALAGTVANVEDCIVDTDMPQLSVLPAGTRTNNDTELLASDRARAILDGSPGQSAPHRDLRFAARARRVARSGARAACRASDARRPRRSHQRKRPARGGQRPRRLRAYPAAAQFSFVPARRSSVRQLLRGGGGMTRLIITAMVALVCATSPATAQRTRVSPYIEASQVLVSDLAMAATC